MGNEKGSGGDGLFCIDVLLMMMMVIEGFSGSFRLVSPSVCLYFV